jgi:hypothetical protein
MAEIISIQRLNEIVGLFMAATTSKQREAIRATLTPLELAAFQEYLRLTPKAQLPAPLQEEKKDQLREEITADIEELAQEGPEELKKLEEESRSWPTEARYLGQIPTIQAPPQQPPTIPAELIIERTPYPKWWKDSEVANISLEIPGDQIVIHGRAGRYVYISSITFTVSNETDITLVFGVQGASGAMSFGGSDEPRGITINMGNSPAPCGEGNFTISASGDSGSVEGFVVFYREST